MFFIFKKYPSLFVAFSKRKDGSMKILKDKKLMERNETNRQKFLKKCGISGKTLISAKIIHGDNVQSVTTENSRKVIAGTDGIITREENLYLSITSADCLPIFLFDPEKEIVGVVHAGWRSLEKNILARVIGKMAALGGNPANILVGIGPAVCQKHYGVGQEVVEKFEKYPEAAKKKDNKMFLDIKKIAESQFLELGLGKDNIEISPECTFELPEKYFSARRDNPEVVEAMMAVIGMKK